jgi:hypothetical protein
MYVVFVIPYGIRNYEHEKINDCQNKPLDRAGDFR